MKNQMTIYSTFAAKKFMKKKRNKNRHSFSKSRFIKKEVTKVSLDLIKMIIYDFWIILKKGIIDYLMEIT
jgi:hypothetical protein